MKRVRLVSLAAAIVMTAIQWAAFFSPALYTQSLRTAGVPVAGEVSDGELPVVGTKQLTTTSQQPACVVQLGA